MTKPHFTCKLTKSGHAPLLHHWEHTVGSGHATFGLRADWQKQLKQCREQLGFRYVRFHGILSDDMGTLVMEQDKLVYSFYNIDSICDFLLSTGMRPFMELSFMPSAISSGDDIVFHYRGNITPPADYKKWQQLISKLIDHLVERYGEDEVSQWFFEVWNEPNLKAFWTGTQQEYFKLYKHTAEAIKQKYPGLKVGGPATAKNEWIEDFISFCKKKNVPLDFISTHHYPTDAFGQPGDNTIEQLAKSHRSVLREQVAVTKKKAGSLPVYYTEWSSSSNPFDELHDEPYCAAFIVKTVMEVTPFVEAYSYWTFSDLFEENYFSSKPFHGGFGLLNINGIAKPAYHAYELLHTLGDKIYEVTGSHETVDVWVTAGKGKYQVLISNTALPKHLLSAEKVSISLDGIGKIKSSYVQRIDNNNGNAKATWKKMGEPQDIMPAQDAAIKAASSINKKPIKISVEKKVANFVITLPPQAVALVTLEI